MPKSDEIILADLVGMLISTNEINMKLLKSIIIGSDEKVFRNRGREHDFNDTILQIKFTDLRDMLNIISDNTMATVTTEMTNTVAEIKTAVQTRSYRRAD